MNPEALKSKILRIFNPASVTRAQRCGFIKEFGYRCRIKTKNVDVKEESGRVIMQFRCRHHRGK